MDYRVHAWELSLDHYMCLSEPGRSTLNVLNYMYTFFPPLKYLSTSTFLFGEIYSSTFRVHLKCN